MKFIEQKEKLEKIYDRFEYEVREYKRDAVCMLGCSFCCTKMGNVDITTLEGMIIREHMKSIADTLQTSIASRIAVNKKEKEKGEKPPCPFQDDNGACLIYSIRPFSCRQLYSLRKCDQNGPLVHRSAVESAKRTVRQIQQLDQTGYSGHISYIMYLLDNQKFRKVYTSDGFDPEKISAFGKSHGIIINRFAR